MPSPDLSNLARTEGAGLSTVGTHAEQLGIRLRPTLDSDLPFLFQLFATTRPEILGLPWSEEQKVQFLLQQLGAQRTDYERRFPNASNSIIERQHNDGFFAVGRFWTAQSPSEIRLLDIAILPQHCSQGAGTALLRDLIAVAIQHELPLRHSVDAQNSAARRLYERLGFQVTEDTGLHHFMTYQPDNQVKP